MVKNLPAMQETQVRFLDWESPGEGNGNPLQYSCLENSMDRGAWRVIVHGVAKTGTQLSYEHFHFFHWYFATMYIGVNSFSFFFFFF